MLCNCLRLKNLHHDDKDHIIVDVVYIKNIVCVVRFWHIIIYVKIIMNVFYFYFKIFWGIWIKGRPWYIKTIASGKYYCLVYCTHTLTQINSQRTRIVKSIKVNVKTVWWDNKHNKKINKKSIKTISAINRSIINPCDQCVKKERKYIK